MFNMLILLLCDTLWQSWSVTGSCSFLSSHFLPAALRQQLSQLTPSLLLQLLHKPFRDWRTRTASSRRFYIFNLSPVTNQTYCLFVCFFLSLHTYFLFYLFFKEVTEKSERITQLEQEKSALIKQLFEARARSAQDTSTLDSTFIWKKKK